MSLHPKRFYRRTPKPITVDGFCGGGGASLAIKIVTGKCVTIAINHNPTAIAVHERNHPETEHVLAGVYASAADPIRLVGNRIVSDAWFSPDCTDHSNAKGGKPIEKDTRVLAWVVLDWVRACMPLRVFIENVPEFPLWGPLMKVMKDGKPVMKDGKQLWKRNPKRKSETFNQFIGQLELLGYKVEWRNLVACDYGAPTKRKRMFLVARRDGQPIVWPAPTHGPGPGLKPYRTAAECIDWSLPARSIFDRKKPLAENTMWRIAQGLKRFIFENPKPFILSIDNQSSGRTDAPLDEPLSTVTSKARHVLVAPVLQHSGNGERKGQAARIYDIQQPIGTVMATGQKHALICAFLTKYFGDPKRKKGGGVVVGQHLEQPIGTVTGRDHHAIVGATLVNYRGSDKQHPGCWDVQTPLPTISAQGNHVAEVRAFLTAYYGDDHAPGHGQEVTEPLRTITTKARLGLVTVHGVDYQMTDITLRMLSPEELLKCQFSPELAADYDLSDAKTIAGKVLMIGNSVSPPPAIALLRANGAGAIPQNVRRAA